MIAVDVSFPPDEARLDDPFDALYQGFSIVTRRLALEERALADIVIAPQLPEHDDMKPSTLKSLVEAGERERAGCIAKAACLVCRRFLAVPGLDARVQNRLNRSLIARVLLALMLLALAAMAWSASDLATRSP